MAFKKKKVRGALPKKIYKFFYHLVKKLRLKKTILAGNCEGSPGICFQKNY